MRYYLSALMYISFLPSPWKHPSTGQAWQSANRLKNNTDDIYRQCLIPWVVSLCMVSLVRWCRGRAGRWPRPPPCPACSARCPPTAGRTRGRTGRGRRARGRPPSSGPGRWRTGPPRLQSVVDEVACSRWSLWSDGRLGWLGCGEILVGWVAITLSSVHAGWRNITNFSQCNPAIWAGQPNLFTNQNGHVIFCVFFYLRFSEIVYW